MYTDASRAIAHKEVADKLKSRWVIVIGAGFALFTVVISYFGSATGGITGFQRLDATIASLTSLVIYFIPILALTLGGGIIADERERGTLELFLSAPISVGEFIFGKFAGLSVSLAASTLLGFGIAGIILLVKTGTLAVGGYLLFIMHSILLGVVFLSASFLLSVIFYERSRVIALTVFLWLLFTILYDLGLIGILIITKGAISANILGALLLLNPVDIYRILNFISIGESKVFLGLAAVEFPGYMNQPLLWGIIVLWAVIPLIVSYYFFKRKYLT